MAAMIAARAATQVMLETAGPLRWARGYGDASTGHAPSVCQVSREG
jgi:hypothetical protein